MTALFAQLAAWTRQRPFVAGCLALGLLLAVGNYFLWQAHQAAARENDDARRRGELLIRSLANRPRIDSDLAALRVALGHIEGNLLDEQSMEVNLGYFYKLEKATRVRLVRLNQLAVPAPAGPVSFKVLQFSMQVSGSYRNSMEFLRALETGPCIARVRNCSFERVPNENNVVIVDLTVEILSRA